VNSIQRWNRASQSTRAGELPEGLASLKGPQRQQAPIEPLARLRNPFQGRFQDGFEAAQRSVKGLESGSQRRPESLGTLESLLTSKEFQQRLQETLAGTSPRAQQVKHVESSYKAFWKDSQDFSVSKGPSLTVPEPPRYVAPAETAWKGRELTVPEFRIPVEAARASQAIKANASAVEARRVAAVAEQPFSLLGRAALRG
jgi:hypothetical protein